LSLLGGELQTAGDMLFRNDQEMFVNHRPFRHSEVKFIVGALLDYKFLLYLWVFETKPAIFIFQQTYPSHLMVDFQYSTVKWLIILTAASHSA
jgi:hypothetical protein